MMTATFITVDADDKDQQMLQSIGEMRRCSDSLRNIYLSSPSSFLLVPNAAFSYWVSDAVRMLFKTLTPFEQSGVTAKAGLCTGDDFRFVRLNWEVAVGGDLHDAGRWTPFAKGGMFGRYYSDIHLAVNWSACGEEIVTGANTGTIPGARPQNIGFFLQPGITWPLRTTSEFGVRVMPTGCISGHKGPAAYTLSLIHI